MLLLFSRRRLAVQGARCACMHLGRLGHKPCTTIGTRATFTMSQQGCVAQIFLRDATFQCPLCVYHTMHVPAMCAWQETERCPAEESTFLSCSPLASFRRRLCICGAHDIIVRVRGAVPAAQGQERPLSVRVPLHGNADPGRSQQAQGRDRHVSQQAHRAEHKP